MPNGKTEKLYKDVEAIAKTVMRAVTDRQSGHTSYLQKLVEGAQADLGWAKGQSNPLQLAALKRVHERFYSVVLAAAEEFVPKHTRDRSVELHRLANFARTSLSALRGHVRAGGDICALTPSKVSKAALRSREGPPRAVTAVTLRGRLRREAKSLAATISGLAGADKAAAIDEIQLVMSQLTDHLIALGVVATRDRVEPTDQQTTDKAPLKVLFMHKRKGRAPAAVVAS